MLFHDFLQAMYETSSEEEGYSEEDGDEASKLKTAGGIVDVEDMGKVSEVLLAHSSLSPACLSCDSSFAPFFPGDGRPEGS